MFDLKALFDDEPNAAPTTAAAAPEPGLSTTPGIGRPESTVQIEQPDTRTEAGGRPEATNIAGDNSCHPTDLLPADGEWDALPSPEPCQTCGGIDCWWGLWGKRQCSVCEPSGQRSMELADKAERLRARAR